VTADTRQQQQQQQQREEGWADVRDTTLPAFTTRAAQVFF